MKSTSHRQATPTGGKPATASTICPFGYVTQKPFEINSLELSLTIGGPPPVYI